MFILYYINIHTHMYSWWWQKQVQMYSAKGEYKIVKLLWKGRQNFKMSICFDLVIPILWSIHIVITNAKEYTLLKGKNSRISDSSLHPEIYTRNTQMITILTDLDAIFHAQGVCLFPFCSALLWTLGSFCILNPNEEYCKCLSVSRMRGSIPPLGNN